MIDLDELSKTAIDILNQENESIDYMGEAADICFWLTGPQSGIEVTLFPSDNDKVKELLKKENIRYYPVKFTPLDKETEEELVDNSFMGVWFDEVSLEISRELAKKLNIDYFFYSFWDIDRIFGIYETDSDEEILYGYTN